MTEITSHVLAGWFAALRLMAENAPGPTQKALATKNAGEVLWYLGMKEYKGIVAVQPIGCTIDMQALPMTDQIEVHQPTTSDVRPSNCRNRMRDEGKAYPKSGCASCGRGGLIGCPHEKPEPSTGQ